LTKDKTMPIAVSIVGFKKSGKTTLTVALAKQLKAMGYTVAGVKFSHEQFDTPDTDTWQIGQVCDQVIGLSPHGTTMAWPQKKYLPDLLPLVQADIVLVEGGKSLTWLPRILVLRSPDEAQDLSNGLALGTWGDITTPELTPFTSLEELAKEVLARGFTLAGLDCGTCGRPNCLTMAQEIVQGKATPADCKAFNTKMKITINGHPLPMKSFVEDMIEGSLKAQLATLKGYVPGSTIKITLT
jgi:molybdopterin-guanine dinucleotide biosynthesis protein B